MPSCLALLLLVFLSLKVVGSVKEESAPLFEDKSWLNLRLKGGEFSRISLQQLEHELKRGKTSQFYGLMGKRARGKSLIQSVEEKALSVD